MDSTPPSSKRMKTRGIKRGGRLKDGYRERMRKLRSISMKQIGR